MAKMRKPGGTTYRSKQTWATDTPNPRVAKRAAMFKAYAAWTYGG